jgi:hypothetical protein
MPNPSLEADLHRHGPWAARLSGLCSASRPKRHSGVGPLSSNVRPHDPRRLRSLGLWIEHDLAYLLRASAAHGNARGPG